MNPFPGFTLPQELTMLREQVRRIVRDEVIPIEQRIDPDAADIPEDEYHRLMQKTKAAKLWCLGAPAQYGGGGMNTFGMSVLLEEMSQHRMGLYNAGCGVFGRYPPPVIYGGTEEQNPEVRRPNSSRWDLYLLRHYRTQWRRRPSRLDSVSRRQTRRLLGA